MRSGRQVEIAIERSKHAIGDGLRFRQDGRRITEVAIAVQVVNRRRERTRGNLRPFARGLAIHDPNPIAVLLPASNGPISRTIAVQPTLCIAQLAGIVTTGVCGVTPVSASEKKIIRNENTRFEARSLSSIQYQVSRYRTAA